MSNTFKCTECHMTFGTTGLLQKHKRKFCVGGSLGDPDNLMLRKGLYSADSPRQRPLSPDDRTGLPPLEGKEEVSKKVRQLRALKEKKEKIRDVRNLEERVLLDSLEDTMRDGNTGRRTHSRLPLALSRHPDVRDLQIEYEMLREKEERAEGYGRAPEPMQEGFGRPPQSHPREIRLDNMSPMSDTSMSIHLEDEDYPHYNPNQEAQLRQLAENHGRQMEYLQIKNRDLEKQREDIRRRLEQLGRKPPTTDNTADLLAELRAQEERNQRALNELRKQLYEMGHKRVNVIQFDILSDNLDRSSKLLELFQEKLYNDPDFDCLVSLHPKVEAAVQLNEDSLMSLHNSKISKHISKHSLSQSCGSKSVSADVSKNSILDTKTTNLNSDRIQNLKRNKSPGKDEVLRRKLSQIETRMNFISQSLQGHNSFKREVEKPTNYQPTIIQQAPPPPPPQESGRKSYIYPVYYGNSLVAEITAMRQAYLQNGGNDPDVLSQLSQMQAEAQKIEDEMKNANYDNRHREKKPDISGKMAMIELENERLHKELMLIQEQNFLNQNRRKTDREGRDKYKSQGHSNHRGEGHSYYKHNEPVKPEKYENKNFSAKLKNYERHMTQLDKNKTFVYKDFHTRNVYNTEESKVFSHNKLGMSAKTNPVVPPLDLSSITGPKHKDTILPKIIQGDRGKENYVPIGHTYTFTTKRKDKSKSGFQNIYGSQDYRKEVFPQKLPDIRHLSDKGRNVGRTQSLYAPRKKISSGSLKGSIRSEIIGGTDADRYPIKNQMTKGDYIDSDLVGIIRSRQPSHGTRKVSLDYYQPNHNKDMNYETVTIKQREELNPDNNHVIHTTTYKEEKLNGNVQ